ncbi:hypothetical protein [Streptomyces hypolithicus]
MNNPSRTAHTVVPALLAALLIGTLSGCGADTSGSGRASTPSASPSTSEPGPSEPSPSEPGASGSASPSTGATESASPPSREDLDESVSAETARVQASASAALRDVPDEGNAMDDVSQGGVPTERTDGLRAALVSVTNSTDRSAFYSVRVDFADSAGKTVDSVVLGFDDVKPGERAERYAISKKAAGQKTFPKIVKAQRAQ